MRIQIVEDILSANNQLAVENRRLFDEKGILTIDIMASPGAGKTSLILQTIKHLGADLRLGVVEGDISSTIDSERIAATGVPVVQINTGGTCHLEANMLRRALPELSLDGLALLLIENVGNLVCPAAFDIGAHLRIMLASIPEGDDKPYKYPAMFATVDAIAVNKIDLLPYLDFDFAYFEQGIRALNHEAPIFRLSCKTGEGVEEWVNWLRERLAGKDG
jgi:hydrogenase nickel incorporation protein HypB